MAADTQEQEWEGVKHVHSYAWDWFSYHAGQRLVMFRFYLVLLAVLAAGYFNCMKEADCNLALVTSVFGTLVTVVFLILEVRNDLLVSEGKAALLAIERHPFFSQFEDSVKLMHRDIQRPHIMSYRMWMRTFYAICLIVFILAAVYAGSAFHSILDQASVVPPDSNQP